MKKFLKSSIVIVLLSLSSAVLALDFSIGGGGLGGYTFTRYKMEGSGMLSTQNMDRADYGGFVFFDTTYVGVSILYRGGNYTYSEGVTVVEAGMEDTMTGTGTEAALGLSVLGKYPFAINESFTVFPLFGVDYHISLMQRRVKEGYVYDRTKGDFQEDRKADDSSYSLMAWNAAWVTLGGGFDYMLTGRLFLRSELLFGFRLPTAYEMGALKVAETKLEIQDPKLGGLTGNPTFKIGIGYKF